jgi:hypothetical protein
MVAVYSIRQRESKVVNARETLLPLSPVSLVSKAVYADTSEGFISG